MKKTIGIDVPRPKQLCDDKHCPFCASQSVRGRIMTAVVTKKKIAKNAQVEIHYQQYVPKYERYQPRRKRMIVHCPPCLDINVGDEVTIAETRKISKTKSFVIIAKR